MCSIVAVTRDDNNICLSFDAMGEEGNTKLEVYSIKNLCHEH